MAARTLNPWPFSRSAVKGKAPRRSAMTVGQSMAKARAAGKASGDTGLFASWLASAGLTGHGSTLRARLKREYDAGVESNFGPRGETTRRTAPSPADLNDEFLKRVAKPKAGKYKYETLAEARAAGEPDYFEGKNPQQDGAKLFKRHRVPDKYAEIAARYFQKVTDKFGSDRVYLTWKRKGTDQSYMQEGVGGTVRLKVPIPQTPHHLYSFLHEVGHALLHVGKSLTHNQEEYEAAAYALGALASEGIELPKSDLSRIRKAIGAAVKDDQRRGVPIDAGAAEFAGARQNPRFTARPTWTLMRFGTGSAEYQRAKYHHEKSKAAGVKVTPIKKESTGRWWYKTQDAPVQASLFNPSQAAEFAGRQFTEPYKVTSDWEFWIQNGEVYRTELGNRGVPGPTGIPLNARWESSKAHFDRFFDAVYRMNPLPPRTFDTMSEAIALSSPSGRMSARAKSAASARLSESLFGPGGLQRAKGPERDEKEYLLGRAAELRGMAARGMKSRAFVKEAERLEAQAARVNPGITDRAKRYRAQNNVEGPKKCVICGGTRNLGVMHLDGNEDHGETANLAWGCKACNGKLAAAFKVFGMGKPTRQYNPAKSSYPTYEQYAWAVSQQKHSGEHGAIIHATPKFLRVRYAAQIARKAISTKRAAADERWNPSKARYLSLGMDLSKTADLTGPFQRVGPGTPVTVLERGKGGHRLKIQADYFGTPMWGWVNKEYLSSTSENPHDPQLVRQAQTSRSVDELARLHRYAVGRNDSAELMAAIEKRAADLNIPHEQLTGKRMWNPSGGPNVRIVSKVRGPGGGIIKTEVLGSWYVNPGDKARLQYIQRELDNARSEEPSAGWTLESRGTDTDWHRWDVVRGLPNPASRYVTKKMGGKMLLVRIDSDGQEAVVMAGSAAKVEKEKKRLTRGNPQPSAQALYESFHGKPATEELVIEEEVHHHEHLAVLGRAVEVWIETPSGLLAHIQFDQDDEEPIFTCSSEDGRQLYFEGGDQSIDLATLKMDGDEWVKDRMVLGQFAQPEGAGRGKDRRKHNLTYHTRKDFDQFREIDYQHDLGEETGIRPYLEYDPRNQHLYVTGGQYHIEQPMLETSPGIEN